MIERPPEPERIRRYNRWSGVLTHLEPFRDLICWTEGLRSVGYVSDIICEKHLSRSRTEVKESARSISAHAEKSVQLLDQGLSGPPGVAFLPLYYAFLNLAKVYIVLANKRAQLEQERAHGASYQPRRKSSQSILTEEIELKQKGAIPLFYEALTGNRLSERNLVMRLRSVYSFIPEVSHEYTTYAHEPAALQDCVLTVRAVTPDSSALELRLTGASHPNGRNLRYIKAVRGFREEDISAGRFRSRDEAGTPERARNSLVNKYVRPYLLYDDLVSSKHLRTVVPVSNKRMLLPEELPILLGFFHLSNVVRYNPEFLERLEDSAFWPMVLALLRHGSFRFLQLFWSYVQQEWIFFTR